MRKIQKLADCIGEELQGAKMYAEKSLEYKAEGNTNYAQKYKEMATQELSHAQFIHEVTVHEIEKLKTVYQPPERMLEAWEKIHKTYVEEFAWIKQMLAM